MNIESILRDISNLYRHCQTYSDVGHSTIRFIETDHINTIKSSMEFSRSGSFSLNYDVNYGGLAMLCTSIARDWNGARVNQSDGVKVYDCLETALKIKAGVSSRITTLIPMLLLCPTDTNSWLYKMTKVEEVDEHIVLSSQCDSTQAFFGLHNTHD